jgi:hypothetical protein
MEPNEQRAKGRPSGPEYEKVTVCLYPEHVLYLDKVLLTVREKYGEKVSRAELLRALVDYVRRWWLNPDLKYFDKNIRRLLFDEWEEEASGK